MNLMQIYRNTHDKKGDAIKTYGDKWTLDGPIENKIEELVWANVFVYGIGGRQAGKQPFNSILARDSAPSLLLYFTGLTSTIPNTPGAKPSPNENAFPSLTSQCAITPNAWLPILQSTLTHPDDHLLKIQRALSGFYPSQNRVYKP
ncbi:hypothetical protein BDQ17DRAFT_1437669 [Cyathus striatus]|nr:hypothetical protein BDQ17DRAFT_1437669 [Cyathus striatus]